MTWWRSILEWSFKLLLRNSVQNCLKWWRRSQIEFTGEASAHLLVWQCLLWGLHFLMLCLTLQSLQMPLCWPMRRRLPPSPPHTPLRSKGPRRPGQTWLWFLLLLSRGKSNSCCGDAPPWFFLCLPVGCSYTFISRFSRNTTKPKPESQFEFKAPQGTQVRAISLSSLLAWCVSFQLSKAVFTRYLL